MQVKSEPFTQINREYLITSAELRKALKIQGEIIQVGLHCGRSPNEIEKGKLADGDVWYINTREIKAVEGEK